jgi:type III restriction enzyme
LANRQIKAEYENKIIFDYPLSKFRADLYSKEIKTLRSDLDIMDRTIQALVLSQYRLKIFQDHHLSIKPVVLLKSSKIAESKEFFERFHDTVKNLNGAALERIASLADADSTMNTVYRYFRNAGITMEMLAQELKEDFSEEHCVSVNDDSEAENQQILLNTLEDATNPYRAIFEVKKLDEGWDVLNLFDIVRLYETRQSGGKASPATVAEAQLIGRGARYCPFRMEEGQPKYQRKYDNDIENPMRICEELYYHCQNDSRYITELHHALKQIGIEADKVVTGKYVSNDASKQDDLYQTGLVFLDDRVVKSRENVDELLASVRDKVYTVALSTGQSGEDFIMDDPQGEVNSPAKLYPYNTTIKEVANINYAIVNKALAKNPIYKFNVLKSRFPDLKSTRDFVLNENYLGNIRIEMKSKYENPPVSVISNAVQIVINKIAASLAGTEERM